MKRFRFGLGSLLLSMLVLSVCLGGYMVRVRQQQRAVARLSAIGATVGYLEPGTSPSRWNRWVRNNIGPDYIAPVVNANCSSQTVDDQAVRDLLCLRRLESLSLIGTRISDEGLQSLGGLPHLKQVLLIGPQSPRLLEETRPDIQILGW